MKIAEIFSLGYGGGYGGHGGYGGGYGYRGFRGRGFRGRNRELLDLNLSVL